MAAQPIGNLRGIPVHETETLVSPGNSESKAVLGEEDGSASNESVKDLSSVEDPKPLALDLGEGG